MSVKGKTSQGSVLSIGVVTGGSTAYTVVGGIKSIQQTGYAAATEDTTQLSSTYAEYVPTLIQPGEISVTTIRDSTDAGQVLMNSTFASLSVVPFKIQAALVGGQTTTGDVITFNAMVLEAPYSFESAKVQMIAYKLKISGVITVTEGS